ncbi:ATP-binding protein [Pumilibacter intestinalis]|uniref:ATP-binding protein n=1 Tax=Pumilibacter intestinalis TaxID=2941511 RepID=UPI00203F27C0|nr:ATP-binding protein [Pumilibacter intestinalis]
MTYPEAVRQIVADYKRRICAYEQAELDLLSSNAEFARNEKELRSLTLDITLGKSTDKTRLKEITAENKRIRAKLGLFPPAPRCPHCKDTGKTGGKYCDCAVALAVKSGAGEIGIPMHTFANVDFSVYGEKAAEYKTLFDKIEKICSTYPANKKRCVIIGGGTGNGKTYLAGCAAQKMLERGMSVMAVTAFAANDRFLKYHTTFDENKSAYLDTMLDCALLVIDDLGTESILKNVTLEYLYQLVNERNTRGKLTLITTNLFPDNILSRYGERIYSRLFDKSLSFTAYLTGKDIRKAL